MAFYLNNCRNRDHQRLFGSDAVYDLNTWGVQETMHSRLRPGVRCVIASQPRQGTVRFAWYTYTGSRLAPDENNQLVHVLRGAFQREESMSKVDAAAHKDYRPFFKINGHFKNQSVIDHGDGDG